MALVSDVATDVVLDVVGEELLDMRVGSADRESASELSSSSESEEDEVVTSCRDFYRRRLSSKWVLRPEEDGNLTESESSDNPESIHTKCHIESDHDSGVEVLNRASSNSSVEDSGRSQCVPEEDSLNSSDKQTEDTPPVMIQCEESANVQSDGTACRFEQLQIRRSSLLDEMDDTTSKFASKMNFLKTQIGSLVEKDNQLFRQLLNLYDSITDLRKSQIFVPSTPSDIVIPEHYSYFSMSRSSSFSSSSSSSSDSDTTVSPASSAASTPVSTPSWTPVSSPSAMSTSSSSRSSYSVKQRSTCCRRCSAYSQRKCRQLPSNSSLSRKKRSFSISNISSGSDSGFELKLHSESDHEIFV